MPKKIVQIEDSWYEILKEEFEKPYFEQLVSFIKTERNQKKIIYPQGSLIFNAFELTPFESVKVVILGQDPYHKPGQAMGLSFSVPKGIRTPPSLLNIYKEIQRDLNLPIPKHGDLTSWAKQGVFLLNTILTVEESLPGSHQNIGWKCFTDIVISKISEFKQGVIFLLWGNHAKEKKALIDENKHYILESAHPSPLAGNKFYNNGHFSKCNQCLKDQGLIEIDWSIKTI
jgi:uracil-DNA glycosylase